MKTSHQASYLAGTCLCLKASSDALMSHIVMRRDAWPRAIVTDGNTSLSAVILLMVKTGKDRAGASLMYLAIEGETDRRFRKIFRFSRTCVLRQLFEMTFWLLAVVVWRHESEKGRETNSELRKASCGQAADLSAMGGRRLTPTFQAAKHNHQSRNTHELWPAIKSGIIT